MTKNTDTTNYDTAYALAVLLAAVVGYQNRSIVLGILVAICAAAAIYGHSSGLWGQLWQWLRPYLVELAAAFPKLFVKPEIAISEMEIPYQFSPGQEIESGQFIVTDLEEVGSFGVYAITRAGKTSFLHSVIYQLITSNSPHELELVIADLKSGLDFSIFRWLRFLRVPIATNTNDAGNLIIYLLQELDRRSQLFKATPERKLCNNLNDYHRLGASLGLPRLPRLVAIFDEFQNLTLENEAALNGLVKIAKEGQAFGISVVCSTQLPNVEALPTKLKSQFVSYFCGYLSNPSHYYKIAEIEKDLWEPFHNDGKVPGRFIASIAGERMIIQAIHISNGDLEKAAEYYAMENEPVMPRLEAPKPDAYDWSGSEDKKRAMFLQWLESLGHEPTADEAVATFGFSQATFYNWMEKVGKGSTRVEN